MSLEAGLLKLVSNQGPRGALAAASFRALDLAGSPLQSPVEPSPS